jgi:hypothetical protein
MRFTNLHFSALIASFAAAASGCAVNSDGKVTFGMKGSPAWVESAPPAEVAAYYDAREVYDLCIEFREESRGGPLRRSILIAIAESLKRRGRDPMTCM